MSELIGGWYELSGLGAEKVLAPTAEELRDQCLAAGQGATSVPPGGLMYRQLSADKNYTFLGQGVNANGQALAVFCHKPVVQQQTPPPARTCPPGQVYVYPGGCQTLRSAGLALREAPRQQCERLGGKYDSATGGCMAQAPVPTRRCTDDTEWCRMQNLWLDQLEAVKAALHQEEVPLQPDESLLLMDNGHAAPVFTPSATTSTVQQQAPMHDNLVKFSLLGAALGAGAGYFTGRDLVSSIVVGAGVGLAAWFVVK